MSTLTNIALNARSMNGVIVISDGGGTIIEDGTVDTDNLITETMTSTNMISTNMIVPRVNTNLVPLLGANINLTTLTQNMNFYTTAARQFEIWNDQATGQIMVIDVSNNVIYINTESMSIVTNTLLNFVSSNLTFTNSSVSFPNSTVSFNSYLPTSSLTPTTGNQLITKTYGDSTYASLTGANTFTDLNTFNRFFLKPTITNASTINWTFADNNFMMLNYTAGPITFNLPTPTTADIGKQLHVLLYYTSVSITFVAPVGKNFNDDINTDVPNKTYNSNVRFFSFTAIATSFALWKMSAFQGITRNYADATYQPVGSYGTLNGANAWTGNTNTFDSYLPTSTIASATSGTQFVTRAIADGRFGQLFASNIFTAQNEFRNGILPCRGSSANAQTDIQMGGNNQFQYRQAASQYNIGIGALTIVGDSVVAGQANNIGKRNIAIGHQAQNSNDNANDCIAIGYQAMQNCGNIRVYTVACQRQIAIGNQAMQNGIYSTDSIAIGTNALKNCTSGNGNIVIAHNGGVAQTNGSAVIIGSESAPTINDNGFVCVGYRTAGFATGSANRCVFVGEQAGLYNNNAYSNTMIGGLAGYNNTVGSQLTCIGTYAGGNGSINNAMNCTAIGCNSQILESWEFVIGGDDTLGGDVSFPRLTLPNKTRLACCQFPTGATINLSFRTNENVILQDATTTIINLPTPSSTQSNNVGCKFYIIRAVTSANNITINAPAGQTIGEAQEDGTLTAGGNYLFRKGESQISVVCIGKTGMTWMVLNTSVSQSTDNIFVSAVIPAPTINYGLPFGALSTSQYYPQFSDTTNLNYKPSTQTLTATNLNGNINITDQTGVATTFYPTFVSGTSGNRAINAGSNLQYRPDTQSLLLSSGTFEGYKSRATAFQYLTQETLITAATTLSEPLRSYYPFTMKTAAGYTITLPEVTALNVGTQLTFKRIGGSLQTLTIAMSANQPAFLLGNAIGSLTNFALVGPAQSCGTMVAIQSQDAGAGIFSNAAASTTITIVTQTSGTLTIGGIINCNGFIRYITAYGTGLGGTGTYIVNTAIGTANTNQAYTSSVTYGWGVTSVQ